MKQLFQILGNWYRIMTIMRMKTNELSLAITLAFYMRVILVCKKGHDKKTDFISVSE